VRRVLPLVALTASRTFEVGARCDVPGSVVHGGSPERQRQQQVAANTALHFGVPLRLVVAHETSWRMARRVSVRQRAEVEGRGHAMRGSAVTSSATTSDRTHCCAVTCDSNNPALIGVFSLQAHPRRRRCDIPSHPGASRCSSPDSSATEERGRRCNSGCTATRVRLRLGVDHRPSRCRPSSWTEGAGPQPAESCHM
jgi:hypothetical protein